MNYLVHIYFVELSTSTVLKTKYTNISTIYSFQQVELLLDLWENTIILNILQYFFFFLGSQQKINCFLKKKKKNKKNEKNKKNKKTKKLNYKIIVREVEFGI